MSGRSRSRSVQTGPRSWERPLSRLLLLSILFVGACGDDSPKWNLSPPEADRWIEGQVRGAGGPIAGIRVEAVRLGAAPGVTGTTASSDSLGRFALQVTAGEYALRVDGCNWYSRDGVIPCTVNPSGNIDTLRFGPGVDRLQADPVYGGARVVVHCGPGLTNSSLAVVVVAVGPDYQSTYWIHTTVQGDSAIALIDQIPREPVPLHILVNVWGIYGFPLRPEPAGAPDTFRCRPGEWVPLQGRIPGLAEATLRVRGSHEELRDLDLGIDSPWLLAYGADSIFRVSPPLQPDATGRIRMPLLAVDDVRFALRIGAVRRWIGGRSYRTATPFRLRESETLELPEVLESGILCRLDPGWEDPWFPGQFELHATTGGRVATLSLVSGNYLAWPNLDPGEYLLRYDPGSRWFESPWLARWYQAGTTRETAVPLVITEAGTVSRIEWPMTPSGAISGTIAAMPDAPTRRTVKLELFQAGDSLSGIHFRSCIFGEHVAFRWRGLEDGDYILAVRLNSPSGERLWWYPGSWSASEAERLRLRDHGRIEGLLWEWPR